MMSGEMVLNPAEINENEGRQNAAFKKWIANGRQFFNIPESQQKNLCDYVEGLHREIADLQAEIIRIKSK